MTRDGVIEHLGTIAKSGTSEFFKNLSGDAAKDSQLIGQFGVGFYSAFIVADKVTVRTRAAGHKADEGVQWQSAGEGDFTVENIVKESRGTEITLHLREEEKEFADDWRLRSIITKYSDHISIPVEMWQEGSPESEGPDGEKVPATEGQWQVMNKATALWTRNKSEISDEEYQEFYKHISHDFSDPLLWSHNRSKVSRNTPVCFTFLPRRLGTFGTGIASRVCNSLFSVYLSWMTPSSLCPLTCVSSKVLSTQTTCR